MKGNQKSTPSSKLYCNHSIPHSLSLVLLFCPLSIFAYFWFLFGSSLGSIKMGYPYQNYNLCRGSETDQVSHISVKLGI